MSIPRDRTGFSESEIPVSDATTRQITPGAGFASILDVLPFSKRAPGPDEYLLGSGDYEVARGSQAIPSAPRAPIFARQAHPAPYGYAQQQHRFGHDTAAPGSQSLAPVAMSTGAMSVGAMTVGHTGSHSAQPTILIADKPSLKWGVLIAVTGAVLGGVLGVGMDAKRQQARVAAAAQAQENAPVAVAQPAALPPVAMQLAAPKPAVVAAQPVAAQPAQPAVAAPAVAAQPAQPAPVVVGATLPPQQPVIIAPAGAARQAKAEPAKPARPPVSHGFVGHRPAPATHPMVAVKVNPPPAEKPEAKPESKPEPKPAAKRTDAQKVLEDAIKNTANTL